MSKMTKFARSFYKNVILRRKFKSFLMILTDKEYRDSLNKLYRLTKDCTKSEVKPVHVDDIVPGHKVIYPAYALSLFAVASKLPHIKVVYDSEQQKYVVVDGNHRLPALILYAGTNSLYKGVLFCEVMS